MPRTLTIPTKMTRPSLAVLRARPVDWPLPDDKHLPRVGTNSRRWIEQTSPRGEYGHWRYPVAAAYEIMDADCTVIGLCIRHEVAGLGRSGEWLVYRRGREIGDSRHRFRRAMSLAAGVQEIARREDKAIQAWGHRRRMNQADELALAGLRIP